jgi:hypothetical protein
MPMNAPEVYVMSNWSKLDIHGGSYTCRYEKVDGRLAVRTVNGSLAFVPPDPASPQPEKITMVNPMMKWPGDDQ